MTIAEKITAMQRSLRLLETKYQKSANSVRLLLASKGQSVAAMQAAYDAGMRHFGENYVQEALTKMQQLPKDIQWHFIGEIQSNKTQKIAEHFAWVESLADYKIAERLHRQRPDGLPPLNILLEVNIDAEASKSGIAANQVEALLQQCLQLSHLKIRGLMSIPARHKDFTQQRATFKRLNILWQELLRKGYALDTLSIGMSDDFEAAIAEGGTEVRIGTAIFGPRLVTSKSHS